MAPVQALKSLLISTQCEGYIFRLAGWIPLHGLLDGASSNGPYRSKHLGRDGDPKGSNRK
jgi:hypothetical protein